LLNAVRRGTMKRALLLLFALSGCDSRPDQWNAYVYQDTEDMTRWETIEGFKTFEQCQSAAIGRIRTFDEPDKADYECGYKCSIDPNLQINVCKETRK
jgi:hypothetical protein